jgi:hypothetical protein
MSDAANERHAAKRAIESLRSSGQPPKLGASSLNVGTDEILQELERRYLDDHCASIDGFDGGGGCKWIEADYGNGKTQFLRCVQELGWRKDYVVGYVELSQDESPLDRPDRVFSAVAKALQAPPASAVDVDRTRGLDHTLSQLLDRRFPGVLSGTPDDRLHEEALSWVQQSLRRTPVESTALATAVSVYLSAVLTGDQEREEIAKLYLRGEPVDAAELKAIGVFEKLIPASGLRLLRSVTQILQRSGLATGTIILFDEARRTLSLMSIKSQKKACENLLNIINHCNNGDFPGTLFLYAVMPEFFTNFVIAYPALQQRCGPATRVNLNKLEGLGELELLKAIASKVRDVYAIAYDMRIWSDQTVAPSLARISKACLVEAMGTGTRRLLVKSVVQLLDRYRQEGEFALTDEDASRIARGVGEELQATEAACVSDEGE